MSFFSEIPVDNVFEEQQGEIPEGIEKEEDAYEGNGNNLPSFNCPHQALKDLSHLSFYYLFL